MGTFSEISSLSAEHLKSGMYQAYLLDLRDLAEILEGEGLHMDELKTLLLEFFFRMNCAATLPAIDQDLVQKIERAAENANLTKHEIDELFLDTVRKDTAPKQLLSVRESLHLLELCLSGRAEDAELIVRSIQEKSSQL